MITVNITFIKNLGFEDKSTVNKPRSFNNKEEVQEWIHEYYTLNQYSICFDEEDSHIVCENINDDSEHTIIFIEGMDVKELTFKLM